MEIVLGDIEVMYVSAEGGPAGAKQAFDRLESCLINLRGRKFYGTFQAGEYRACVALQPEDRPSDFGLSTWIIPGGRYARKKVKDWNEKISQFGEMFDAMAEEYAADPNRPSIEFYRSQRELHLLLPVLSTE
jgi:hypothetical protein